MPWAWVFGTAAVLAILGGLLSLVDVGGRPFVKFSPSRYDAWTAVTIFVVVFLVNMMFFAWFPPVFHAGGWVMWALMNLLIVAIISWGFDLLEGSNVSPTNYRSYHSVSLNWPNVTAWVSVLGFLAISVIGMVHAGMFNPLGQERATKLATLVQVTEPTKDANGVVQYPQTDQEHIPVVHESAAREKASRVLGNEAVGTRYELGNGELQVQSGNRLVYIFELKPKGLFDSNKVQHKVPHYVVVDAENPNAGAQLSKEYDISYYPGGYFESNMERLVWRSYPGYFVDDLSIEVNDEGEPFYTASLNRTDVRWDMSVPVKFITVNAVTGKIDEYKIEGIPTDEATAKLSLVPAWVDRVYSAQVAKQMLDWWGHWGAGPDKAPYIAVGPESGVDRYKVAGEPNLVFTNEGPAWQVLMTGFKTDTNTNKAAQSMILMDTRTNRARIYPANGVQIEDAMLGHFKGKQGNTAQLVPEQAAVYEIFGRRVWVGGLIPSDKLGKPGEQTSFAGVGIIDAVGGNSSNAIIASTNGDAFNQLSKLISSGSQTEDPAAKVNTQEITSVVAASTSFVEGGTTRAVIELVGDTDHVYSGVVTYSERDTVDRLLVSPGDTVIVKYTDDGTRYREIVSLSITIQALQPTG